MNQKKYYTEEWAGKRYGHLTIIKYENKHFVCQCDCGNIKAVKPSFLFYGKVKTCGLDCKYHKEKYPGYSYERLHGIWYNMLKRCSDPNASGAKYYYARGIKVCEEWKNSYESFKKWAESNGYEDDLTIDRIDCDGDYEPSNCRWATYRQQASNKHPIYTFTEKPDYSDRRILYGIDGEYHTLSEWGKMYGITESGLKYRMQFRKMGLREALTTPKDPRGSSRGSKSLSKE